MRGQKQIRRITSSYPAIIMQVKFINKIAIHVLPELFHEVFRSSTHINTHKQLKLCNTSKLNTIYMLCTDTNVKRYHTISNVIGVTYIYMT